jgi:nitrogen regulatory protein PII
MLGLKFMTVITKREYSEHYFAFLRKNGITTVNSLLCNGTASGSTLDLLGLEKTENMILQAVVPDSILPEVKKGLVTSLKIDEPGNGIAIFVQVDGVGGEWSLNKLIGTTEVERKEEKYMSEQSKSVLIVTIVDKGYNNAVMDAARDAGAGGGTVVRAKGTGAGIAKFFGVSISEEKEMVYIVSARENRDAIMKAIIEKTGGKTKAHGIVFSLPVDSVLGIRAFENVE